MQGYGICRLSIVPVRAEPAHKAEQVTQLLFGDHYEVTDASGGEWLRIRQYFDGYEGWIDSRQHHAVTADYFHYLNQAEFKITTDITSTLLYNRNPVVILMGSILPISSAELFRMEEQFAFNGESKNLGQRRDYSFIDAMARKYLHAPYLWGGRTPFGIDCSGFTQVVFKLAGYKLLRDASMQFTQGNEVLPSEAARPGDLAFFQEKDRITHVGIVMGGDRIIHASGRVRIDTLTSEGIVNTETQTLTHQLAGYRRILSE